MGEFAKLAKKVGKIDIYKILEDITRENDVQKWIKDTIKNRFLKGGGVTADGTILQTDSASGGNPYSNRTMDIKDYLGQEIRWVTLKDTGDFWESLRIIIKRDGFETKADFMKKDGHIQKNFTQQYGSQKEFENAVDGLSNDELIQLVSIYYYPRTVNKLNEILS